jgi:hypothetical protein
MTAIQKTRLRRNGGILFHHISFLLSNCREEYSHSFRIARETKFINLKKAAIEYWDLEKEERKGENVSAFLELFDDEGNRMTTSSGLNDNMI